MVIPSALLVEDATFGKFRSARLRGGWTGGTEHALVGFKVFKDFWTRWCGAHVALALLVNA